MDVTMDRDLPQGKGIVLDAAGQQLAIIDVPGGSPPAGGTLLVLSIEDYGAYLRTSANAQRRS